MRKAWDIEEVKRLAAENKSGRAISAKGGISRTIVALILHGRRPHDKTAVSGDVASSEPTLPAQRSVVFPGNAVRKPTTCHSTSSASTKSAATSGRTAPCSNSSSGSSSANRKRLPVLLAPQSVVHEFDWNLSARVCTL